MAGLGQQVNASAVVACVNEFYATTDSERRQQLDKQLCQFKTSFSCEDTIATCIHLMDSSNSANVQYFGAISIYDTVRKRSDECIANLTLMEGLKTFLIDNLASSAHIQMQSITNKLSSTLALLALYCIPDVWQRPVQDLTQQWSNSPELLLRVLAEMAAEFSNIQMPLTQRSVLKTELHRISEEIILIITTVMGAADASPSTRQAAVECVEQWVQLPGVGLDQWTYVLHVVFGAVTEDNAALTNLLNILAANDELSTLEALVLDICQYITQVAAQSLAKELREESDSEEVVALVSAVCALSEKAVPTLIRHARNQESAHLTELCQLFVTLSSWDGRYPVDESISDLPAIFWTTLREELMHMRTGSTNDRTAIVIASVQDMYASTCASAVTKLAYPTEPDFEKFDKEQREQFATYRRTRSDVSINAFYIVGDDTLKFLNEELEKCILEGNVCRTECVLYMWELVADYLSEEQYAPICQCLQLCTRLSDLPPGRDGDRLGGTLMRLLFALSHLVLAHDNAVQLVSHVLHIVVAFLSRPNVVSTCLTTLLKYVADRPESLLQVGDSISERCYALFMNESASHATRLDALKCIGYILSMKPSDTVMDIINRLISPHVSSLVAVGDAWGGETTDDVITKQRTFQISIFGSLFSTLNYSKNPSSSDAASPVVLILRQAMPVFRNLLCSPSTPRPIGNKVCEGVRQAIGSLNDTSLAEVFPFVSELIDHSLLLNAPAACMLAKSAVLLYGGDKPTAAVLCSSIARWFAMFEGNMDHADIEEWLGLIYQIVKKDWKTLRPHGEVALAAITSAIAVSGNTLVSSSDPSVVRLSSQVLATIATQTTSFADEPPRELLARNGPPLVKAIFNRIQNELMRNTVEALSEVLFFFVKHYPQETRAVLSSEDRGDSPMVAAMFREVGNLRNFKQMTLRLNQACRTVA